MSITCTPETQKFGNGRVCRECGIPKPLEKFPQENSVVCQSCVPTLERRERRLQASITPEETQGRFIKEMNRHLESASPATIEGYDKAREILGGRTPQEVAACMVNELLSPGARREDLSEEQRLALPTDYKTLFRYLQMLESSGRFRDEQLAQHNPLKGLTQEEITAIVVHNSVDYVQNDKELRLQLIRGFMARCPTFLEDVMEVAREQMEQTPKVVVREKGGSSE